MAGHVVWCLQENRVKEEVWRAWSASSAHTNTLRWQQSSLKHTVANKITSKCLRLCKDCNGEAFRTCLRKHCCRFQQLEQTSRKLKSVAGCWSLLEPTQPQMPCLDFVMQGSYSEISSAIATIPPFSSSGQKKAKRSAHHGQLLCFITSKEAWGNRDRLFF